MWDRKQTQLRYISLNLLKENKNEENKQKGENKKLWIAYCSSRQVKFNNDYRKNNIQTNFCGRKTCVHDMWTGVNKKSQLTAK